jgi:uncharacterized membrane protein
MDITALFAAVWGPILVAVGLGFFLSTEYYTRIYRDLEKESFAVLFFGMFAMAAGIAHVLMHTLWGSLPQILVTLLGWGVLIKGVICVTFPKLADRGGDWALNANVVPAAGVICLILGVYLSWVGYFM